LDLRPATGHFIHRRAASHDRREARSKRSSRLCAGRSDSRVYPPCQGVSGGAWRCQVHHPANSLWLGTQGLRRSLRQKLSERAGLCCSKPVELSAKPPSWLGFRRRTQVLPEDSADASSLTTRCWTSISDGVVREVAFFHKRSRTLLVTDSVLSVPEDPPAIVQLEPYPLLFHARDDAFEIVEDNPASRRKGWQRISLLPFATECAGNDRTRAGVSRCPQSAGSLKASVFRFVSVQMER